MLNKIKSTCAIMEGGRAKQTEKKKTIHSAYNGKVPYFKYLN